MKKIEARYPLLLLLALGFYSPLQSMIKDKPISSKFGLEPFIEYVQKTIKPYLILKGHTHYVHSAQFNHDSTKIVTASDDKTAKVWEVKTGNRLHNFKGHGKEVTSAQFGKGEKVITASWDGTVKVWYMQIHKRKTFEGHTDSVNSAKFSPDGKKFVTASRDGTAIIWNIATRKKHKILEHGSPIYSAQFNHDGEKVVTGSEDKTAKIWNAKTGKLIQTLEGHTRAVGSVQFSPDDKKIATVSRDETVKIWDVESGEKLKTFYISVFGIGITDLSAQFDADSKRIAIASLDGDTKIWDVKTGELLQTIKKGHTDSVISVQFSSPDGEKVVTASYDKTAKIWDVKTGKLLHTLEGHTDRIHSAQFSPDGKKVVTASDDKTAIIWLIEDKDREEAIRFMQDKIDKSTAEIIVKAYEAMKKGTVYEIEEDGPEDKLLKKLPDKVKKLLNQYLKVEVIWDWTLIDGEKGEKQKRWYKFW